MSAATISGAATRPARTRGRGTRRATSFLSARPHAPFVCNEHKGPDEPVLAIVYVDRNGDTFIPIGLDAKLRAGVIECECGHHRYFQSTHVTPIDAAPNSA